MNVPSSARRRQVVSSRYITRRTNSACSRVTPRRTKTTMNMAPCCGSSATPRMKSHQRRAMHHRRHPLTKMNNRSLSSTKRRNRSPSLARQIRRPRVEASLMVRPAENGHKPIWTHTIVLKIRASITHRKTGVRCSQVNQLTRSTGTTWSTSSCARPATAADISRL